MRRFVKWVGGTVGGIAAYRFVRRQEASLQPSPEVAPEEPDTRAEELRTKLAETRAAAPVTVEEPPSEPEPELKPEQAPEPEQDTPESRRRRVHEEGRAALDEMRSE